MAKFEIPECVATIIVMKLDGNITTMRYKSKTDFMQALVRANLANKRKTYKELVDFDEDKNEAWIVIKSKDSTTDSEESEE